MKFTWFNLMPWPYLPDEFRQKHRSVWVDIPSSRYDPVKDRTRYNPAVRANEPFAINGRYTQLRYASRIRARAAEAWGNCNRFMGSFDGDEFARRAADSTRHRVDSTGHLPQYEQANAVPRAIAALCN